MRRVTFKTTENQKITFTTTHTSFVLDQEDPYGIEYRKPCTSTLPQSELNEWWSYVDLLLTENPITNFHSVWKITEDGSTYGYQN